MGKSAEPAAKPTVPEIVAEKPVVTEVNNVEKTKANTSEDESNSDALKSFLGEIVKEQILVIIGLKTETVVRELP